MNRSVCLICLATCVLSSCISITLKDATTKRNIQSVKSNPAAVQEQKPSEGLNPSAGWARNYGTIKQLYVNAAMVYFKLEGGETEMNPNKEFYYVPIAHPNYAALKDLLYLAAEKRYIVKVRTENQLDANGFACVQYIIVDW
jgi:hypothetical protein